MPGLPAWLSLRLPHRLQVCCQFIGRQLTLQSQMACQQQVATALHRGLHVQTLHFKCQLLQRLQQFFRVIHHMFFRLAP